MSLHVCVQQLLDRHLATTSKLVVTAAHFAAQHVLSETCLC